MKYDIVPQAMWAFFEKSFGKELTSVFNFDKATAAQITKKAKAKYKSIIDFLPEFEKEDNFKINILSCAMLGAFVVNMPKKPTVEKLTAYYKQAMMTAPMKLFCKISSCAKFTSSDIKRLEKTQALRAADRNPFSWNMELLPYDDGSGYEARFTKCGICELMKELGIFELTPALCKLDYTMSEAGGKSIFVRKHTLAQGGPYCDCGYKKK